jgi:hypothetical protein
MSRSRGSLSTVEAKKVSEELSQILGTDYKYNFDILRVLEMLLCQRIQEQVSEFDEDTPLEEKTCEVEIPLIGTLTITPSVFHDSHGMTNEPSKHFDFNFKPTSAFKQDVLKAYNNKDPEIGQMFAEMYLEKVHNLYNQLREDM